MVNRSTTITGAIAILAATLVAMIGIPIGEGQIVDLIESILKIVALVTDMVAAIVIWRDRVKKGDVKPLGARITPDNSEYTPRPKTPSGTN